MGFIVHGEYTHILRLVFSIGWPRAQGSISYPSQSKILEGPISARGMGVEDFVLHGEHVEYG